MAVSHTITNAGTKFPAGSTVNVYASTFSLGGTLIASGVVAANGTVTFTGLKGNTAYLAAQLQGGTWVTINFTTVAEAVVETDLATQAELDSAVATLNASKAAVTYVDTSVSTLTVNPQTASYTLVLADRGRLIELNSASATVVTVPTNASVAFPVGSLVEVVRYGAGAVSVAGATGVTLRGGLTIGAQYGSVSLLKRATDEWLVFGGA